MKILITGIAGFIGYHVAKRLSSLNYEIIGIDNINDYYDVNLKFDRLSNLGFYRDNILKDKLIKSKVYPNLSFSKIELTNNVQINDLFSDYNFDIVLHLAAQAGVRYSITNPNKYIESNIIGFFNIIHACKEFNVRRILYASSSSVYGLSQNEILNETQNVDYPISLYAATKKSNELLAHTYSHLFQIETIGLRFFTVYGPWGRPDMAPMLFANSIFSGSEITIYNGGNLFRDFTYIDDIVESILRLIEVKVQNTYSVFNIGNGNPINLLDFIKHIENITGINAIKRYVDMQPGDVISTYADTNNLFNLIKYRPNKHISDGLNEFINWYRKYYLLNKN